MIDCALISSDDAFRRLVRGLAQDHEAMARLVVDIQQSAAEVSREALARVAGGEARVVFVDLGGTLTGVRVLEALSQEDPGLALIAAGPQVPADSLLRVIRAGATEYLPRPITPEDVSAAFQRVKRRVLPHASEAHAPKATLTAFFSTKGGTGVTTLAANVALALRELTGEETLLIDLAPSLGTAALQLGLQPRYSYLDVIQNFHRIDQELLRSFLEVHESGLSVLASPPLGDGETAPSPDQVVGLLRLARRHFAQVVVDVGNRLTSEAFAALMESDQRVMVATADLPALRNLRRALELLQRHNGKTRPFVVVNRFDKDAGLTLRDVEAALAHDVAHTITGDDLTLREAVNVGQPAVLDKKSRFSKEIFTLGTELAGPDHLTSSRQGLLGSFLRPFRGRSANPKESQ